MSDLIIKTEVWLQNGPISAKLSESNNVLHEGDSSVMGNTFIYKSDDDDMLHGQYVTNLTVSKLPEPVNIQLNMKEKSK